MSKKGISYPHPVLGIGDDIDSTCKMTSSIVKDSQVYKITFEFELDNNDLLSLVQRGYAIFGCEINCAATFYRRFVTSTVPRIEITIPKKDVAKRIEFECTVTAVKNIVEYVNSKFNDDFKGFVFSIEPGDILAFIGDGYYDADIKYDKLRSAGSFVKIVEGEDEVNTLYKLDQDKIEICLPKDLFEDYRISFNGPGHHANIFHSSLAFNALFYALMNYKEEDHKDLLWARTLKYRLEVEESLKKYKNVLGDSSQPLEILKMAQDLLSNPYKRMFNTMHSLLVPLEINED